MNPPHPLVVLLWHPYIVTAMQYTHHTLATTLKLSKWENVKFNHQKCQSCNQPECRVGIENSEQKTNNNPVLVLPDLSSVVSE